MTKVSKAMPISPPGAAMAGEDVLVLNGPNLNLQGSREPDLYGTTTLANMVDDLALAAGNADPPLRLEHVHSNQ